MNTKEEIRLLIFDYYANDVEYSSGISNADKSLSKCNQCDERTMNTIKNRKEK